MKRGDVGGRRRMAVVVVAAAAAAAAADEKKEEGMHGRGILLLPSQDALAIILVCHRGRLDAAAIEFLRDREAGRRCFPMSLSPPVLLLISRAHTGDV
eukprot:751758-Hanusia_phi.AAC.1